MVGDGESAVGFVVELEVGGVFLNLSGLDFDYI